MNDDIRVLHRRLLATEQTVRKLGAAYEASIGAMATALQQLDLAQQDIARRLTVLEAREARQQEVATLMVESGKQRFSHLAPTAPDA